ncbi:MAG TPA: DUF5666 domain-containing protein [Marinagarivorans sp.]
MQWKKVSRVIAYAACCALAACGSNNDDEVASIIDGSGAPVPDIAVSGPITGFGSVIVNGVHYETDQAEIFINGEQSSEEGLEVGDYISLEAAGASATVIYAESVVRGAVDSVNAAENTVTVLNQRVRVSGNTIFDANFSGGSLASIPVGERLDIRGSGNRSGDIYATRVSKANATVDLLSGAVSSLDTAAMEFRLAGVTVDYHQVVLGEALENGQWVSVTGSYSADGNRFTADSLRIRTDKQPLAAGVATRIEGLVDSPTQVGFELNGQRVLLQADTQYLGDGTQESLLTGAVVVVEGTTDVDGALLAESIRFLDTNFVTWDGAVEDFDNLFGVTTNPYNWGTITVADKPAVIVNVYTAFVGFGADFAARGAHFGDVRLGDRVYISALALPESGGWVARTVIINRMPQPAQ